MDVRRFYRPRLIAILCLLALCKGAIAFAYTDQSFNNLNVYGTLNCKGNVTGNCGGGGGGGGGGLTAIFQGVNFSSLPTCNSGLANRAYVVLDSLNTCQAGNALTGGGSGNACLVGCNGTAWAIIGTVAGGGGGITAPVGTIGGTNGNPIVRWNPVTTITSPQTAAFGGAYICNASTTVTLPATSGSGQAVLVRANGFSCTVAVTGGDKILGIGGGAAITGQQDLMFIDTLTGNWEAFLNSPAVSGSLAGSFTNTTLTTDMYGRITGIASGPAPVTGVTASAPLSSTGGTTPNISAQNSGVSPGSYTNMNATVDAFGRVTSASSGSAGVTSVTGTSPVTSTGGTTPNIALNNSGVTAGSYTNTNVTVDALGRVTAAANGSASGTGPTNWARTALFPVYAGFTSGSNTFPGTLTMTGTTSGATPTSSGSYEILINPGGSPQRWGLCSSISGSTFVSCIDVDGNCTAGSPCTISNGTIISSVAQCPNSTSSCIISIGTTTLGIDAQPPQVGPSGLLAIRLIETTGGGLGVYWHNSTSAPILATSLFSFNGSPGFTENGGSTDPQPNRHNGDVTDFIFHATTGAVWDLAGRSIMQGQDSGGQSTGAGPQNQGNYDLASSGPVPYTKPCQWTQLLGDNSGVPQGSSVWNYNVYDAAQLCNMDSGKTDECVFRCATSGEFGTSNLSQSGIQAISPGQCLSTYFFFTNATRSFTSNLSTGNNWQGDICYGICSQKTRIMWHTYQNQSVGRW